MSDTMKPHTQECEAWQSTLDENNILHVPGKKSQALREDGSICWLALRGTMDKLIGYDMI